MEAAAIERSLADFGIVLNATQLRQVSAYLDLLLRWNHAINLTAIDDPVEVIRRHFAESIYLTRFVALSGELLDVGSGAGFPGLAIKIAVPGLSVVLLEPVVKKRAFLKEVIRECGLADVEVSGERIESAYRSLAGRFEAVTIRALGSFEAVLPAAAQCVGSGGEMYLWLTGAEARHLAREVNAFERLFSWGEAISIPLSHDREIWRGKIAEAVDKFPRS